MAKSNECNLKSADEDMIHDISLDPDSIMDILSDPKAMKIYQHTTQPRTATDYVADLDISESSTYRKLEKLEEAGLLTSFSRSQGKKRPHYYRRVVDQFSIECDESTKVCCEIGELDFCYEVEE